MIATRNKTDIAQIGVISTSDVERNTLRHLVEEAGFSIGFCGNVDQLNFENEQCISVWLVDLCDDESCDVLDKLQETSAAILINDEKGITSQNPETTWQRRLIEKLDLLIVNQALSEQSPNEELAEDVWVLAASLGGPEAIIEFLSELPLLPIAMIYAQHIEAGFEQNIIDVLNKRQSNYRVRLGVGSHRLLSGNVIVLPKENQVRLLAKDRLVESRKPWEGHYKPAIDQIITEIAQAYRKHSGVIVFSGTCDDGAVGSRIMSACGGKVWIQSPSSCLASAMPEAVEAAVRIDFEGTPKELAAALAQRYKYKR